MTTMTELQRFAFANAFERAVELKGGNFRTSRDGRWRFGLSVNK